MKVDVIEGINQYPIKAWLDPLVRSGLITKDESSSILHDDKQQLKQLDSASKIFGVNVPKYIEINGASFSWKVLKNKISRLKTTKYNLRLTPKLGSELNPFRIHGITQEDIKKNINNRIKLMSQFIISISEHFKYLYSGTIISTEDSFVVEFVEGQHFHLTQSSRKKIYQGKWDKYRMYYNTNDLLIRMLIWRSVRKLVFCDKYDISPLNIPSFAKGYFEFLYDDKFNLVLTNYTTHPFFVKL